MQPQSPPRPGRAAWVKEYSGQRLAVDGDLHEAAAVVTVLERMNDDADLVTRLHHVARPALAGEVVRAAAFDGPLHFLAGRGVLGHDLHPDVRVGPLQL